MDKEHFHYRNPQGIIEQHHVSEFRTIFDAQEHQQTPPKAGGNGVEVPKRENDSQTPDQPVQGVEKEQFDKDKIK